MWRSTFLPRFNRHGHKACLRASKKTFGMNTTTPLKDIASFRAAHAAFSTTNAKTPAAPPSYGPPVTFTFVEGTLEDGNRIVVQALCGKKLVDVALENDVDIEAACGGELACSTCHCVYVSQLALFQNA